MLSSCVPILRSTCSRSSLRVAKTVRAQMTSMDALLVADPGIRVIHVLSDPRQVVSSRLNPYVVSVIGQYTLDAVLSRKSLEAARREAEIYCRTAVNDIRVRSSLEAKYPGRILALRNEDVIADPRRHANLVYRFLGFDGTPKETRVWMDQNNAAAAGGLSPLEKATKRLAPAHISVIVDTCSEYYRLTGTRSTQSRRNQDVVIPLRRQRMNGFVRSNLHHHHHHHHLFVHKNAA